MIYVDNENDDDPDDPNDDLIYEYLLSEEHLKSILKTSISAKSGTGF